MLKFFTTNLKYKFHLVRFFSTMFFKRDFFHACHALIASSFSPRGTPGPAVRCAVENIAQSTAPKLKCRLLVTPDH